MRARPVGGDPTLHNLSYQTCSDRLEQGSCGLAESDFEARRAPWLLRMRGAQLAQAGCDVLGQHVAGRIGLELLEQRHGRLGFVRCGA